MYGSSSSRIASTPPASTNYPAASNSRKWQAGPFDLLPTGLAEELFVDQPTQSSYLKPRKFSVTSAEGWTPNSHSVRTRSESVNVEDYWSNSSLFD